MIGNEMQPGIGRKLRFLLSIPPFLRRRIMTSRYRDEISNTGETELRLLRHLVDPNRSAVDVGCNLGVYAFRLGQLANSVLAFEPNPALSKLVEDLHIEGVQVRRFALSDKNGHEKLYFPDTRSAHVLASLRKPEVDAKKMKAVEVETATLDSFEIADVGFLKIDVEGHEEAVLAGAVNTIKRCKPNILCEIEERHNKGGICRIVSTLDTMGYRCIFYYDKKWNDIDSFDYELHHDYWRSHSIKAERREDIPYCNNFIFISKHAPLPSAVPE